MTTGRTRVWTEALALPMARLGRASNMPRFGWQQPMPDRPTPPDVGLSDAERANRFRWGEDSILPYQVYDDYDRELRAGTLDGIVIENERLRAVIAPSLGGRLIELKEMSSGRDLVFRNPVFQPANLAALNAWFSGGIEWNGLIPGHSPFTCAPVFAGMRETPDGPIVRIYEFDRIVEATWQIDLFLPAGADHLFAHGRIVNPSAEPRLAYWWTNIAAPMSEGTRVLSPADYAIEHLWPGNNLGRREFPRPDWDGSYPDNWVDATSVFFRAPAVRPLFIAAVDRDGFGLAQVSTEMAGRKFFYFGSAAGGQNWMDYLSRPGEGRYLEIQSGLAPTQNQRFVLGAGEEREWTEVFMPIRLDSAQAPGADYHAAVAYAGEVIDSAVPADELERIDAFLREQARQPLDLRYATGQAWGVRQEWLTGRPLAAGLDFSVDAPGDFWDDLARGQAVKEQSLRDLPEGTAVSASWIQRVRDSAEVYGETWLHALTLATASLDRGDRDAARAAASRSLALRESWSGYRIRALASPDVDIASADYIRAWGMGDAPAELAVEIATHFMRNGRFHELKAFVDGLAPDVREHERIVLACAVVAADEAQLDELERLLTSRRLATIREGETLLSDLWTRLRRGRLEARLGRAAGAEELRYDLAAHPLPWGLDLRMHGIEEN